MNYCRPDTTFSGSVCVCTKKKLHRNLKLIIYLSKKMQYDVTANLALYEWSGVWTVAGERKKKL